jgi:putative transposase
MKTIRKILHPRKRLRLDGYDYAQDGYYYVTICVFNHKKYFGDIHNGTMELNDSGQIVDRQFIWLKNQYSYINIPIWIVMPDHVHAIIEINRAEAGRDRPLHMHQSCIKIKPLPELIGAFKTTTSKKIHQTGKHDFRWQRSYHERIIRGHMDYTRIYNYIKNNTGNI